MRPGVLATRHRGSAMWHGVVAASIVVALLVAACGFSTIAPDAQVHIAGRVVDAQGRPLVGARVRLFKEPDLGEFAVGTVFAIGSLGTACLLPGDVAPSVCRAAITATTDGAGGYSYTIPGRDTQGSIGQESTLDIIVADPHGGRQAASTTLSFDASTTAVSLPVARLWDAAPHIAEQAGGIAASWQPLPVGDGSGAAYSVELSGAAGQGMLWSQPAATTSADVDARVIEDVRSLASVGASASLGGGVRAVYTSAAIGVTPIAGAPPSRGHPCSAVSGPALATTPQAVCRATDGDLASPSRLTGAPQTVVTGVVVDLGSPRRLSLVVVRGVAGQMDIEGSTDGTTYVVFGTASASPAAVQVAGATARYVRVRSPAGIDESFMSEISVW